MNNNKILLFGKNGQLGFRLFCKLNDIYQDNQISAFDLPDINFINLDLLNQIIEQEQPNLIINATAYTNVDRAEENVELANMINGHAVGLIARKAQAMKAGFIHYSTDYVFDGTKGTPYFEDDPTSPINTYGASKVLGEELIQEVAGSYLLFRLSWVYSLNFPSFTSSVLAWARKYETLRIVDDQISNPTSAVMVADKTIEVINRYRENWYEAFMPIRGIYHLVNKDPVSRFEWAKDILALDPNKEDQVTKEVVAVKSTEFPTPAKRPLYSGLDCSKFEETFNLELPHWRASLIEIMRTQYS